MELTKKIQNDEIDKSDKLFTIVPSVFIGCSIYGIIQGAPVWIRQEVIQTQLQQQFIGLDVGYVLYSRNGSGRHPVGQRKYYRTVFTSM